MAKRRDTKILLAAAAPIGVAAMLVGSSATGLAATVLTLEGGLVGIQHIWHFTPSDLRGDLCKEPNTCEPVDYFALPVGPATQQGGELVSDRIATIHANDPTEDVVLFGHSQGGQVIYSALRDWSTGKLETPDPERVTWVSTGNPENKYGGTMGGIGYTNGEGLPENLTYDGTEVIRQYDGWADEPDDTGNLLAVLNAQIGRQTLHTAYEDVDLTSDKNVTVVEYQCASGDAPCTEENAIATVTYVWVPTDTLPLVAWTGPFAPALDNLLRPMVDSAYTGRPEIPDPTPPTGQSNLAVERIETKSVEVKKVNQLFSVKPMKPAGREADSVGRALASAKRTNNSVRPVRDAISTVKKAVDRVTERIADRVSRAGENDDGGAAEAQD